MNTAKTSQRHKVFVKFAAVIALFCLAVRCVAQGTLTFTFEGQPSGTRQAVAYSESGVWFGAHGVGSVFLSGGSIPGYTENGTGYLQIPEGYLTVNYPKTLPTFSMVSFDAAEYLVGEGPSALSVVGYRAMAPPVTNYFTLDGISDGTGPEQDFQTFYLDSSFVNLFRVDMYARFSLDNVVISGVPEPSSGALILLGICSTLGWSRMRRKRSSQR